VYLNDADGDGIFDREEYLLGTDKNNADTDGDTLTDYEESKTGLEVTVAGDDPYHTYSDPRSGDTDGDALDDHLEFEQGTDPMAVDTDRDGQSDASDDDPLAPYQCQNGRGFELMTWWDGSTSGQVVQDVWADTDGALNGDAAVASLPDGDLVFDFDQSETDSYISVPHSPVFTQLTQQPGYTVSLWMLWSGHPFGATDRVVLLGKGASFDNATFRIYVDVSDDGTRKLKFTQQVKIHLKRWCWPNTDGCAADRIEERSYTVSQDITDILIPGKWMHIAARFDRTTLQAERMSICADGRCETKDPKRPDRYGCGAYYCQEWFIYNTVDYPSQDLVMGLYRTGAGGAYQFPGKMDDVQIFGAYLSDELMQDMSARGRRNDFICRPEPE
jgi:hypothetical protein